MSVEARSAYLAALGIDVYRLRERRPDSVPDAPPAACRALEPAGANDDRWPTLEAEVSKCTRCELHRGRTQTVFGVGRRNARLLVIETFREVEARQTAAVGRILTDLARASHRVKLGGLGVGDVTAYAEASGGMTVAPAVAQAIHEATDGNAYFVGELVALLQS